MIALKTSGKRTLKVAEKTIRCLNCPLCRGCRLSRPLARESELEK